jgi:hypothetical protein
VETWQPLSVRAGAREPDEPYEGAPPHLLGALISWIDNDAIGHGSWNHRLLRHIITYAQAQVPYSADGWTTARRLYAYCSKDEGLCLNVIDAYLQLAHPDDSDPDKTISAGNLRSILAAGGSVWTVSPDNRSLQRAVDPQTQAAIELATSFADVTSNELREAWARAYGRNPDPSDDHFAEEQLGDTRDLDSRPPRWRAQVRIRPHEWVGWSSHLDRDAATDVPES